MYSSQEVGYIALQCPENESYHIQAENVLVEILDDDGLPCEPGEVGRVVVTALHNLATPLLRYDIGDYAEVGSPCSCGRRVYPCFGDVWSPAQHVSSAGWPATLAIS